MLRLPLLRFFQQDVNTERRINQISERFKLIFFQNESEIALPLVGIAGRYQLAVELQAKGSRLRRDRFDFDFANEIACMCNDCFQDIPFSFLDTFQNEQAFTPRLHNEGALGTPTRPSERQRPAACTRRFQHRDARSSRQSMPAAIHQVLEDSIIVSGRRTA